MSKTSIAALFSEGKTRTAAASSRVARPVWRRNSDQSRGSRLRELLVPLSELLVPLFSCWWIWK